MWYDLVSRGSPTKLYQTQRPRKETSTQAHGFMLEGLELSFRIPRHNVQSSIPSPNLMAIEDLSLAKIHTTNWQAQAHGFRLEGLELSSRIPRHNAQSPIPLQI